MGAGFSAGSTHTVAPPSATAGQFRHGGPCVAYDEAFGCFREVSHDTRVTRRGSLRSITTTSSPGQLFRLVDERSHQWHFYNDTTQYDFIVTGFFGSRNEIRPLGGAKMYREYPSNLLIVELTVGPLETVPYLQGEVRDGFDLNFSAVPRGGRASLRGRSSSVSSSGHRRSHGDAAIMVTPVVATTSDSPTLLIGQKTPSLCPQCRAPTPSPSLSMAPPQWSPFIAPQLSNAGRATGSFPIRSSEASDAAGALTITTSSSSSSRETMISSTPAESESLAAEPHDKKMTAAPDSMLSPPATGLMARERASPYTPSAPTAV